MIEQAIKSNQGIPIYSYPNPHLHSFCICLYVKGGPMYENTNENGISHFFEHIVFKNINRHMNGELFQTLDRLGLSFNACTYRELIQFTITGATKHFQKAAEIISCLFVPITLPDSDIDLERKRILAEIREEDEKKNMSYFAQKNIWKDTPLCQPIPGKKKRLKHMTKDDLRNIQQMLLTPENCFYYLSGTVNSKKSNYLCRMTDRFLIPASSHIRDNMASLPDDFCIRKRQLHHKKSSDCEICFAFDYKIGNHTQAQRSILYDLLFSGEYCRIFLELSEKTGLIYSYDSHLEEYKNGGNILLSFEISPTHLEEACKIVTDIFCQLKRGEGICLDYVLPIYLDNNLMQLDDAENLNWTFAYEKHFLGENWNNLKERMNSYLAVTPENIRSLACEIFRADHLTLCYKGRKKHLPDGLKDMIFDALS